MEILHEYYYNKKKALAKAIIYIVVSVLLVAFAAFCFTRWDLSFMFTEWQGYVLMVPYFLVTLGIILSIFENFKKVSKTNRGIPALAVGADSFVLYDNTALATTVPFEDCDRVRFKSTYSRIQGTRIALIIKYHNKMDPQDISRFEVNLSELDRPQSEIDKQLKRIYNKYKKKQE